MGWNVHLHVAFKCTTNDGVAALAQRHLTGLRLPEEAIEARLFLEALANRSGENLSMKGGLSLWGLVGNHTDVGEFCEVLVPFWHDLLSGIDGGPLDFERVVVFEEQEQSEAAAAYQIGWDHPDRRDARRVQIQRFERLPFSWGQY